MRITTLLCSFSALIAAGALALPATASAAAASGPVTPSCAWHELSVATNVLAQDSSAAEWLLPFTVQDGLQIRLDGRYPDSRYASLQVYQSDTDLFSVNGVSSGLTDYQIHPDFGSLNPWQYGPRYPWREGDAFTVTLQSRVAPGQTNALPLAPVGTATGTAGYLGYRVYLPAGGDFARVPLPVVTFTLDGVSTQVPACPPGSGSTASATAARASATAAPGPSTGMTTQPPEFARPLPQHYFPNADSGYLSAVVMPPANGDVVVIRGRAPTASWGSHPSPWPAPFVDLRYWSLCNYLEIDTYPLVANALPDGRIDYGCRYDSQVAADRDGYYTFVVGTEAQRALIERIPGATFLPFSTADPTTPHLLFLRNMLANPGFAQAVQNVPPNKSPASAARSWGPTTHAPPSARSRPWPAAASAPAWRALSDQERVMSAVLRLRRHSVVMEIVRGPFEVALDGARIGTVSMGETFETPISEGSHTISLRSGRYSSRRHSFDVLDDEVASFQCHSGLVWPLWILLLVRPGWVIWLRHL